MIDMLRPFLSRVIGTVVGALVAWLAAKGINIDAKTQQQVIEALITIIIPVYSIAREIVHRLIDKRINPADAASTRIAQASIRTVATMKARGE